MITACFNSEQFIEETIQSVLDQSYPDIEYIIVDGRSSDGTMEIVKRYEDSISKIISEPDEGVYDAMNKGIQNSTGDIIYFLNSGDHLHSKDTISNVIEMFSDDSVVTVYGNVRMIGQDGQKKNVRGCRVTLNSLLYRRICHQALFVRKELFDELGLFSLELKLSADHEFIVRAFKKYPHGLIYMDKTLAEYRDDGMSCRQMTRTKIEDLGIIAKNYDRIHHLFGAIICGIVILKYKIKAFIS
ncbi:glycosyltransferase family 2 protein [Methanolobus zinderi]|uniref:glycosyltransferase family 2 protein n=1 Tax=Methanolobus zinderi TaxID=536044 RepID=UPI001FE9E0AA|nr:glycosyltransferase family 2 protein [Methanolobus zinderi]